MRNGLFLVLVLTFSCREAPGTDAHRQNLAAWENPRDTISEEALIRKLSAALSGGEGPDAAEHNRIVNHAIDELINLEFTPTGLFYQILSPGEGPRLQWADYIRVHYQGYFLDGRVFDSSYSRGEAIRFYVGNMIPGWNEGLQLLSPGGRARLVIPSRLAYGEQGFVTGRGDTLVPPHTILAFDIEVLEKLPDPNQ